MKIQGLVFEKPGVVALREFDLPACGPQEIVTIRWRGISADFPAAGETAVVIGQGLIGAFAAKWLLHHGAARRTDKALNESLPAPADGRLPIAAGRTEVRP